MEKLQYQISKEKFELELILTFGYGARTYFVIDF